MEYRQFTKRLRWPAIISLVAILFILGFYAYTLNKSDNLNHYKHVENTVVAVRSMHVTNWEPSPTDQHYAFEMEDNSCRALLLLGAGVKFVSFIEGAQSPTWSPNGRLVAYIQPPVVKNQRSLKWTIGNRSTKLRVLSIVNNRIIIETEAEYKGDSSVAWKQDGSSLIFVREDNRKDFRYNTQLMLMTQTKQGFGPPRPTIMPQMDVTLPMWRPATEYVSYIVEYSRAGSMGSARNLNIRDTTPVARELTLINTSDSLITDYTWSPNGSHVVALRLHHLADPLHNTLEVVEVNTGKHHTLSQDAALRSGPDRYIKGVRWSPDGKRIAVDMSIAPQGVSVSKVSFKSLRFNIIVVEWPSGKVSHIIRNGRLPRWSNDGKKIYFIRDMTEVWEAIVDGVNIQKLFDIRTLH